MPIRVTCTSCHTRFNVSDKFAGKEGPCPKCKATIRVPDQDQQVIIDIPDDAPKDSKGRSVLRPIQRRDTVLTSVQITLIAVCIIGFLLIAFVLRMMTDGDPSRVPWWLVYVAALAIAPPIAYVAYSFLRNQELGTFVGQDLWGRVLICSVIYALLWLAMPLGAIAFNDKYDLGSWMIALIAMLGLGGATGMLAFDFDYLLGLVHYGMYLGICLIGRWLAGLGVLPGMLDSGEPSPWDVPATAFFEVIDRAISIQGILMLG